MACLRRYLMLTACCPCDTSFLRTQRCMALLCTHLSRLHMMHLQVHSAYADTYAEYSACWSQLVFCSAVQFVSLLQCFHVQNPDNSSLPRVAHHRYSGYHCNRHAAAARTCTACHASLALFLHASVLVEP